MPGLIENVCNTSYGYVDPYIQKTRNAVPLFDKAAHVVEANVPPLIKQVDHLAEPAILKIKPRVEPLYNKGVEEAQKTIESVRPVYNKCVETARPYVEGGEKHMEEAVQDVQKLFRVAKSANLQDLKTVSKVSAFVDKHLSKVESLIDRYLPPSPNDLDTQSDNSSTSTSSLVPRVASIPFLLMSRVYVNAKLCVPKKEDLTVTNLKSKVTAVQTLAKVKAFSISGKAKPIFEKKWAEVASIVKPKYEALSKTPLFKKFVATAGSTAKMATTMGEKVLGKEKMKTIIAKLDALADKILGKEKKQGFVANVMAWGSTELKTIEAKAAKVENTLKKNVTSQKSTKDKNKAA